MPVPSRATSFRLASNPLAWQKFQAHFTAAVSSREDVGHAQLLGERAGVRASVSSNLTFGGRRLWVFFKVSRLTSAATIPHFLESTLRYAPGPVPERR